MRNYRKYTLKVQTLTPIILSPRASFAFYRDALIDDDDSVFFKTGVRNDFNEEKEYSVIYPFFRYGEYEQLNPSMAAYYIPGSSIKGALSSGTNYGKNSLALMVDDITGLNTGDFKIISPKKSQYFNELPQIGYWENVLNKQACDGGKITDGISIPQLLPFFAGTVGIESLRAGVVFNIDIRCESNGNKDIDAILSDVNKTTVNKLESYINQLTDFIKRIEELHGKFASNETVNKECCMSSITSLQAIIDFTAEQMENAKENSLIFLGGYKGLIRSIKTYNKEDASAIFVDNENRPFGFAKVIQVGD